MRVKILYEDTAILVCHKPAGLPVQTRKIGEMDLENELKNYLRKSMGNDKKKEPYLGIVHRLDQPVEGVMVVAKTPQAAAKLSEMAAGDADREKEMKKYYKATVYGHLTQAKGELNNYLLKDGKTNTSKVVSEEFARSREGKMAKKARLSYQVINSLEESEELLVRLYTGRHHQIRVQLSGAGVPILGDTKYGSKEAGDYVVAKGIRGLQLRAVGLEFPHPETGEIMKFLLPGEDIF